MTVQELIDVLRLVENKDIPVYLFDDNETETITKEVIDCEDLEDEFNIYVH